MTGLERIRGLLRSCHRKSGSQPGFISDVGSAWARTLRGAADKNENGDC